MSLPLVSAIIPTYNRRDMIASAVDSVLAQTYSSMEVIVVDDGSTDGSAAFLHEHYGDRIRVIEVLHGGAPSAVNSGVRAACGEFIAFLDSDDFWLPEKIETQMAYLEARPGYDICYCNGCFDFGDHRIPMFSGPQPSGDILEDEMEFDHEALDVLRRFPWPGNVRQLRTVVERLYVLCPDELVTARKLAEIGQISELTSNGRIVPSLDQVRVDHVKRILAEAGGSVARTATIFGVHRSTIYRWLRNS